MRKSCQHSICAKFSQFWPLFTKFFDVFGFSVTIFCICFSSKFSIFSDFQSFSITYAYIFSILIFPIFTLPSAISKILPLEFFKLFIFSVFSFLVFPVQFQNNAITNTVHTRFLFRFIHSIPFDSIILKLLEKPLPFYTQIPENKSILL